MPAETVLISFGDLTFGEMLAGEAAAGMPFHRVFEESPIRGRMLLAWLTLRRDDPAVTLDEVEGMPVGRFVEAPERVEDDAGPPGGAVPAGLTG